MIDEADYADDHGATWLYNHRRNCKHLHTETVKIPDTALFMGESYKRCTDCGEEYV